MIGHFFYGLRHHLPKGRATFICFYSPSSIMEVSLEIGHRGSTVWKNVAAAAPLQYLSTVEKSRVQTKAILICIH